MTLLALRFSLDSYTNWANSPGAALIFWGVFVFVVVVVSAITLWLFRHARPH